MRRPVLVVDRPGGQPYPRMVPNVVVNVWSINRWLRWTGFRIFIMNGYSGVTPEDFRPARIGVGFWGWKGLLEDSLSGSRGRNDAAPDPEC